MALAMRRGRDGKRRMVNMAEGTFFGDAAGFGQVAVQAMTRPMAAPAGNGLHQHQTHHQFGGESLHAKSR
jgi:hypothetical protein